MTLFKSYGAILIDRWILREAFGCLLNVIRGIPIIFLKLEIFLYFLARVCEVSLHNNRKKCIPIYK